MSTWDPDYDPGPQDFGPGEWFRIAIAWSQTATAIYGLLVIFWLVRVLEWPFGRPITPEITKLACRLSLRSIGIRLEVRGKPMRGAGAVVANHVSWLDIFAMNSLQRIFFVAKSEIKRWTGVGVLAKTTNAVFITRDPRMARHQQELFAERFRRGDTLLFFPEGTSTDGMQVLPFKTTLFAAFFHAGMTVKLLVQPVTVNYRPPAGEDPRFYGFWGSMGFRDHVFKVLSVPEGGSVELIYHEPVAVAQFSDRKELARYCEQTVRSAHKPFGVNPMRACPPTP